MNLSNIINAVNYILWSRWGVYALILCGIYASIRLGFFQLFHCKLWFKKTVLQCFEKTPAHKDGISPFESLCISLASSIGVGNITGVAFAIYTGGPGAVFWMWLAAFFGMIIKYCEVVLGVYFRRKNFNGSWSGGAMYYLRDGVGSVKGCKYLGKSLAWIFSLFTLLTSCGMGSIGQVNKIVINMASAFPVQGNSFFSNPLVYRLLWGIFIFVIALVIILGGLKRTAYFSKKAVPIMLILFVVGSLCVILKHSSNIIPSIKAIFKSAFTLPAGSGGLVGTFFSASCIQGFKRGMFSNESALGSSVFAHSSSSLKEPCEQGMWGILEVFVDTFLVCTLTALVILTSGSYHGSDATMVAASFNSVFAGTGEKFIALMILVFAFTSVIAWNQYGSSAWEYLFGTSKLIYYRIFHVLLIIPASLMPSFIAWEISDAFNALMMLPNLIGVIVLTSLVNNITINYLDRIKRKKKILPMLSFFSDIQKNNLHH